MNPKNKHRLRLLSVSLGAMALTACCCISMWQTPSKELTWSAMEARGPVAWPEEQNLWDQQTREVKLQERLERHEPAKLEWVSHVPRQPGIAEGGLLMSGVFVDRPPSESERRDVRLCVFSTRTGTVRFTCLNALDPEVRLLVSPAAGSVTVLVYRQVWRGGPTLSLLKWNHVEATLAVVDEFGGEEEAEHLSYAVTAGGLVLYGMRPERQSGFLDRSKRVKAELALEVQLAERESP